MTDTSELRHAIEELERVQRTLGQISTRTDADRTKDLIAGRRALASQLALVGERGLALFESRDPELAREFRRRFGAMRSSLAYLQASWPAVHARDDTTGEYARSVAKVKEVETDCVQWVKTTLLRLETQVQ